ncbi:MAG: hypothetical protein RIR91_946 [Verrucomicrobiota bacterium]|jgi:ATP-dependent protease ClpP protease subunit
MQHLQQLRALARNQAAVRPLAVDIQGDTSTVWIYDFIGHDPYTGTGISAEAFAKEIRAITTPNLLVRINSPGGSVFDGRAMFSALQMHPAKKTALVEGVAASAATSIAMAADSVQMVDGALFMIHRSWTMTMGNAEDLLSTAALLEKVDAALVNDYAGKTGADPQQIKDWMSAETWFTAQEAQAAGFVDQIISGAPASASWDLSPYAKAPNIPAAQDAPVAEGIDGKQWEEAVRRLRLIEKNLA